MIRKLAQAKALFVLCAVLAASYANACTISEDMEDTLPFNSVDIPNSDRLAIADMVLAARKWPDVEIRGIVYAGGYVKENDPKALADRRAAALKEYLIQLGIKEGNIWVDTRTIKKPDVDHNGKETLNQIAVTLVPICSGGCERLCNDPRVTPNSRAIQ
jgi:outer membrane protein OmpA-like peptidoglycan-associated protein